MATKAFSSRADEKRLAYADALTREQFGMSFGQYCGSILVDAVYDGSPLPQRPTQGGSAKARAVEQMKAFSGLPHDPAIGRISDNEVKSLIASRYE